MAIIDKDDRITKNAIAKLKNNLKTLPDGSKNRKLTQGAIGRLESAAPRTGRLPERRPATRNHKRRRK